MKEAKETKESKETKEKEDSCIVGAMFSFPLPQRLVLRALTISAFLIPLTAHAAPATVTYTYDHHLFTLTVAQHPEWRQPKRQWYFNGVRAVPPAELLTCGDEELNVPGWTFRDDINWNEAAIANSIEAEIGVRINRPAGNVIISKTASGTITFDGLGLPGRHVSAARTAELTRVALEHDVSFVELPVEVVDPVIDVRDEKLKNMGIREVVTVGESVFSKSPVNRRHNIKVGVGKFNGHLIPKDAIFSFDETLGPVNAVTGFRKELVIQGDTTLPDYGGGLCQVSTTAFRGPWEYGMPIVQRKNHSYAVSYYSPQGTDATIYPPNVDMKFKNDTPGALLIQSFVDDFDQAFFIYYGTRDNRKTDVYGPYISDRVGAPKEERTVFTTEIPVGERRKAGERHDGMKALWYRSIAYEGTGAVLERMFSAYEARPLTWQVGVSPEDIAKPTAGDASSTPSWLPTK